MLACPLANLAVLGIAVNRLSMDGSAGGEPSVFFSSSLLRVQASEQKGRYLVSTKKISSGELIFETRAYSIAIHPSYRKKCCINCLSYFDTLLTRPCQECKKGTSSPLSLILNRIFNSYSMIVWYCSEECARKDGQEHLNKAATMRHGAGTLSCTIMKRLPTLWRHDKDNEVFVLNVGLLLCRKILERNGIERGGSGEGENVIREARTADADNAGIYSPPPTFKDVLNLVSHLDNLEEKTNTYLAIAKCV